MDNLGAASSVDGLEEASSDRFFGSAWLTKKIDWLGFWLWPERTESDQEESYHNSPEFLARNAISIGFVAVLIFFGLFGLWAVLAPLDSAAIATGRVILDSNKKTIQHLEGGIVDKILVREGDVVSAGQPLIRLDETTAKARYDLLRKQYYTALATEARLIAERDHLETISFSKELIEERGDEAIAESIESQERLFESRRTNMEGRISILKQRIEQFHQEIKGLESQSRSASQQIRLLGSEIRDVQTLVNNKNAPRSKLLSLQREQENLKGERGEYGALIARAEQSIGEAEIEIINVRNEFINTVNEELKETQVSLSDLEERIRSSADTFKRINILSPIDGVVVDTQAHTIGGVIRAGDKIMDIVPTDDILVVEALVEPQDIDIVRAGLHANIRLSPYKARFVPPVRGEVEQVSADRFDDEKTGLSYYKARIIVDKDELAALEDVELYPGMPTEVLIVTGERTLISYLFAPIRDSFSKSFREN